MRMILGTVVLATVFALAIPRDARAQMDFEGAPIEYGKRAARDRVAKLADDLAAGKVKLQRDARFGLLPAMLEALEILPESQTLVFSKTSFQLHKISPDTPRALYFNDDTYVGWVRGSEILELGAADGDQGASFYTLEPNRDGEPRVLRDQGQCLICHATIRTQGVPGFLIRSVYCNTAGRFVSGTPTFVTDHSSPFEQRWGGWYVSGTHGAMRHLGNLTCDDESTPGWLDPQAGLNQKELPETIVPESYLRPTSDIVALMVMEHQTQMHNLITRASFEARTAAYQDAGINKALDRPADYQSESTQRRIANVSERMVRYMLMADEFVLTAPVAGTSAYASKFSQRGPHDRHLRSLYELDLQQRLFKYPCSYLIYSESFDGLPETVKQYVGERFRTLLLDEAEVEGYEKLTRQDRIHLRSILSETKKEFWQTYVIPSPRPQSTEG